MMSGVSVARLRHHLLLPSAPIRHCLERRRFCEAPREAASLPLLLAALCCTADAASVGAAPLAVAALTLGDDSSSSALLCGFALWLFAFAGSDARGALAAAPLGFPLAWPFFPTATPRAFAFSALLGVFLLAGGVLLLLACFIDGGVAATAASFVWGCSFDLFLSSPLL